MSRLIVKNLPKNITEDKLRNYFGQKGFITDIQLKYTKDGVFRQFAFIGYQSENEADAALKYFNNSCIQTNRIKVEKCASLGSENKPKAWSKYSNESSAYKKQHKNEIENENLDKKENDKSKKKNKNEIIDDIIGEHKNDPEFIEFMKTHSKTNRLLWDNDAAMNDGVIENTEKTKNDVKEKTKSKTIIAPEKELDDDSGHESDGNVDGNDDGDDSGDENEDQSHNDEDGKLAEKEITDLEYMKTLMINENSNKTKIVKSTKKQITDLYTIKIYNLPYQTKRSEIIKFFKPIKPYSIRLPTNVHGFCYVGFKTEKDFQKAWLKDKSFIKKKQVFFTDFTEKNKQTKIKKQSSNDNNWKEDKIDKKNMNPKWLKQEESIQNEEDISESGKIFFRNLAYTTTEDDLQTIFEKYGPIAEINLPVDPITRQIKGFGTVTYVMPEHAVKAFNELDGSMFQGRLLHLIPGKCNDKDATNNEIDEQNLGYKAKKALNLKKSANQSHNWNTLFLGANAVADIMSKRLDTTKEAIFDESGGYSAAVRLALGETEIVLEMKKFLEENDVQLSVFDSIPKKRSKTTILVKNLPANTTVSELKPLFTKFGPIGRFLLPPSGVTALIEYMDPSEARKAFSKLAYSKFKNLPLYLEWAPEGTFKSEANLEKLNSEVKKEQEQNVQENVDKEDKKSKKLKKSKIQEENIKTENEKSEENKEEEKIKETIAEDAENDDEEDDEPPEPETTIFLKNLNFKTREGAIREHFKHLGQIHMIQVATKKDPNDPKNKISLGYGFIQFKKRQVAQKALKQMQFTQIEGNQVELKRSDRTLKTDMKSVPKKVQQTKQTGTKILVKNVPFQAKPREIEDLFKVFGELRSVRLPKKMTPGENTHRGFGFVDFFSKSDAKKAFETLYQSTHLYGRRLVLEWAAVDNDNVDELRKRTAQHFAGNTQSDAKRSRKSIFDTSKITNDIQENIDDE